MPNYNSLLNKASEIQSEQSTASNTAVRIGGLMAEIISAVKSAYDLAERAQSQANEAWNMNVLPSFDEMWTAAGGSVVSPGSIYELNGLGLDFNEAVEIFSLKALSEDQSAPTGRWAGKEVRTLFPIYAGSETQTSAQWTSAFERCSNLEIVVFRGGMVYWPSRLFYACVRLREISGDIDCSTVSAPGMTTNMFYGCEALEEVRISGLGQSIDFRYASKLSAASLSYLAARRKGSEAITVTVHSKVFSHLSGNPSDPNNAGMTADELSQWMDVARSASSKNVIFAKP